MIRRTTKLVPQTGLSYVETLVAIVILSAILVPATTAIHGSLDGAEADIAATGNHFQLRGKLEEVLAEPFTAVAAQAAGTATPSSYSDAIGTANRRLVFISPYDGDNADADNNPFTGTDAGLLWLQVRIENAAEMLQVLKSQ